MEIKKTFCRVYASDFNETLSFYTQITGKNIERQFRYPGIPVDVAYVGDFLIIAGDEEYLNRFRKINSTCIVDNLSTLRTYFLENGGILLRDPQDTPSGRNMTVRHPDGLIVEYVELKSNI